jgi:hypothetical protein
VVQTFGSTINFHPHVDAIVFSAAEALLCVSASGGAATPLTTLDPKRGESSHRWPPFLSDGRNYLFTVASFGTNRDVSRLGIYIGALDSPEQKLLIHAPSNVGYANGFLLLASDPNHLPARIKSPISSNSGSRAPSACAAVGRGHGRAASRREVPCAR